MKTIDLNKTLFDITEEFPDLIPVLAELGFAGAANPVMRNTHGRIMTLSAGCGHLGIDKEGLKKTLAEKGYNVL